MKATKRVLVVDDDPVVGMSFERVLWPKGYAVITASNGEAAFERLAAEDYDMVYTDIKMPGLSGIEVARRIRASRPWLPVVIVTGYGTEENEKEARDIGVADFIHKPLSPEAIEGTTDRFTVSATVEMPHVRPAAKVEGAEAAKGMLLFARNVGFFFLAPLLALLYVVVGPIVGLAMLAWMGLKALLEPRKA